jgi:glycosyltransferase involved in cell wall biosynthesis
MDRRPQILFLSPCWPLGRTFGGQLRALHTARALQPLGEVTLMVVGSEAGDEDGARLSANEFKIAQPVTTAPRPNRQPWERLRWAIDIHYLNVHGFAASSEDRSRVVASFNDYDLVWVLNARTPNLLQVWQWPHAHLDLDDIPSGYLRRIASTEAAPVKRWKARTQRALLHRRERLLSDRFTTLSVCSESDRAYLGSERVHVIPNGFARPNIEPQRKPTHQPPRIGFIGLYSYAPNLDGVRWFLREAWPIIRREIPDVRFRMIGRDTDGALKPREPNVDALGWLEDPADEIATWSAMVIPIRLGGGTRIKIADAFSRKCPVVSTRFGAHGYEVQSGKHLLLADAADAFARACIHVIRHPELGSQLAESAWKAFLRHWTWDAIAPKVRAAAADCLARSRDAACV